MLTSLDNCSCLYSFIVVVEKYEILLFMVLGSLKNRLKERIASEKAQELLSDF